MRNRTGLSVASVVTAVTLSWTPILPSRSGKPSKAEQQESFRTKLSKDLEELHALNRLTYGPRPGDLQRVQKIGVKKWIDLQLHPERIRENRELERKLQPLVSLAMTDIEIVRNYPPPQMVVAVATGRAPLPADPEQRA